MTLNKLFAWLVGVLVFLGVGLAFTWAGNRLGVPSDIDLHGTTTITHGGGRASYDEEVDSLITSYGMVTGALSMIFGLWAGRATYARRWHANFTKQGWLTFWAWSMALGVLAVLSVLIHLAFKGFSGYVASYARMIIEVGAAVGVGWACHQWWKNRVRQLSKGATT